MMLLECPLLVSPILDSLLAVHIRIYTIVEVQVILTDVDSQIAFGVKNEYLITYSVQIKTSL